MALFAYRILAVLAFEALGSREVLLAFPNVFEFWFVFVAGVHRFAPGYEFTMRRSLLWLAPVTLLKEFQEYAHCTGRSGSTTSGRWTWWWRHMEVGDEGGVRGVCQTGHSQEVPLQPSSPHIPASPRDRQVTRDSRLRGNDGYEEGMEDSYGNYIRVDTSLMRTRLNLWVCGEVDRMTTVKQFFTVLTPS